VDGPTVVDVLSPLEVNNPSGSQLELDIQIGSGLNDQSGSIVFDDSSIKENGALEIDAAEFTGDSGATNNLLQTDGASLSWFDLFGTDNSWTGQQDLSSGGFVFPVGTTPSPTVEGQAVWDSDDDVLRIGAGGSTVTLDPSGGGSALVLDLGNDGTNESTDLQEISTDNDSNHRGNSVVTEPNSDEARWDMGEEWPSQRLGYINHYVGGTLISNMDFTGSLVDPAGPFEGYLLWVDMLEMSSPTYPFIQFSDDSGSTWLSGSGYDYVLKNWGIGYVSSDSSGSAGSIRIGAGASNSNELVDRGYGSKIKISAGNSSITNGGEGVVCHAHYTRAKDSQVVNFQATGHYASGVDITGIRLGASGESFENYNVTLYGVSRA
jgi:hypothetical protein